VEVGDQLRIYPGCHERVLEDCRDRFRIPGSLLFERGNLIPMVEFLIENTTDPNRISFLVTGVYKFRVGVRRSGSTDTITSADLSLRKDGVNA
jgi:hypothetical protein